MAIDSFLRDNTSLITAIATLIAAITALVKAVQDFRNLKKKSGFKKTTDNNIAQLLRLPAFGISILLALVSIGIFASRYWIPPLPVNVQLVSAAWEAFNKPDYLLAVDRAQECIDMFGDQALQEQEALSANNSPMPPIGNVSDTQKSQILSNGILNDAATCYFIKAFALEKLNRLTEARAAYIEVQKFPHARTLDVSGSFWSPMSAASGRIQYLDSKVTPVPTP
jgi:hypothetical protein